MNMHPCSPADFFPWPLPVQVSQVPMQQSVDASGWPVSEQIYMHLPFSGLAQTDLEVIPGSLTGLDDVDAPAQFDMDDSVPPQTAFPQSNGPSNPVSKNTVRRRSGQELAHKEALSVGAGHTCADDPASDSLLDELDQATFDDDASARKVADKLLAQLKLGDHQRQSAMDSFQRLMFKSKLSSRAAQMILADVAEVSVSDAEALSSVLRGIVRSAVQSKHANYVVQKIVEVMPAARTTFVIQELLGVASDVAKHRFGCRILCRILEHFPRGSLVESTIADLLNEILDDAAELSGHQFGSYVIRHFFEYGLPEHHRRIVFALSRDVTYYAKDKYGSHVVEAAISFSSGDAKLLIVETLLSNPDQLIALTCSQFGRHVVKALLRMKGDLRERVVEILRLFTPQLQASRYGKSILKELRPVSVCVGSDRN